MKHLIVVLAYERSDYLESCIKSLLFQKSESDCHRDIIIATSTPNDYIRKLAKKYKLDIKMTKEKQGIAADFDFALSCATKDTDLLTIAHQDDIYSPTYSQEICAAFRKRPQSIIIFSDYFELRNGKKIFTNTLLKVKRFLLTPLKISHGKTKFTKRLSLCFGDPICCPAVTFNPKKVKSPLFKSHFKCNVDWHAWETLSHQKGNFTFVNKKLMGHRIHEGSTTTDIIKNNIRTKEDEEILRRFWPAPIAHLIAKIDSRSEKSNQIS